jgi:hypothetical protein
LGRILLVSSACAVELSVWMGVCGCGCPISLSVCRMDTAVLALMNSAPNSASAADDNLEPLDAAIGQVPVLCCPGSHYG